jgi:hypothetical protein
MKPPYDTGYDATAFRAAGCSWVDVKTVGFTAKQAKAAGCDPKGAVEAGYDRYSLKDAGFDIPVLRAAGCDWAAIRRAGFTAAEAKDTGCDLASVKAAGYALPSLVQTFGPDAVIASGCDVSSFILVSCARAIHKHALSNQEFSPPSSPHLSPLSPQHDGSNLYMTLHVRKVDDRTEVVEGFGRLPVPAGFLVLHSCTTT